MSSTETENIAPDLVPLVQALASVQPHPDNARDGDVGALCESLREFGQQKPIVVQKSTMLIAAGTHLWKAARAMGWQEIAMNITDMDDQTAAAYREADNRTSDLASYNQPQLAKNLEELARAGRLRGTGYDGEDVDTILKRVEKDMEGEEVKPEVAFTEELLETHQYVVFYFDNELDWNRAREALGLGTVKALARMRKDGEKVDPRTQKGVQRVLKGTDALKALGLL